MSKAMQKPDAQLDGQEFSAITRLLEALAARKEIAAKDDLEKAESARKALYDNSFVADEDLEALLSAAKAYQKAVEDDKIESVPNVKGDELKKLVKKLEGMVEQGQTEDDKGNKVHPASLPAGDKEEKDPAKNDPVPPTKVEIVKPQQKADDVDDKKTAPESQPKKG